MWAPTVDAHAWIEIENISKLPFLGEEGFALMADAHGGSGVPIGCVLPTKGVVIPNAIGNDCGCGMRACKTNVRVETITPEILRKSLMRGIRKVVPIGDVSQKVAQDEDLVPKDFGDPTEFPILSKNNGYHKLILKQLGTLGMGNHFIELQKDGEGWLWVMIHSGSRGVGGRLNQEYDQIARNLNSKYFSVVPDTARLAFLPKGTKEFDDFWHEMEFTLAWAKVNRQLMMDRILQVIGDNFPDLEFEEPIDIHHNYAAVEEHGENKFIIHRKGATRAGLDEIGIIPGSQGTASYIVKGLGSEDSFQSCSHGAGRKMSRTQAVNEIDLGKELAMMEELGIVHAIRGKRDLEEAASAYKNIEEVMENQRDLVEPLVRLFPIAVLKG